MARRSTLAVNLLALVAVLPPADATAQYWSLGLSIGGGTTVAVHGGMHLGSTEDPRDGLNRGRTEMEVVVGLPTYEQADGRRKVRPGFGFNVRQTAEDSGLSAGFGFRFARAPTGSSGGYRMVFHVPVGWEPYPLPGRLFVYLGVGERLVPSGSNGFLSQWRVFIPWPQLQLYLKHTGGFFWT